MDKDEVKFREVVKEFLGFLFSMVVVFGFLGFTMAIITRDGSYIINGLILGFVLPIMFYIRDIAYWNSGRNRFWNLIWEWLK
ncbi:MAG: hypothetical protein M1383_06290 [Patescibacteria group bacterium]|nr:hypothetical protein [Patescibacteria group bacterium]